VSRSQEPNSLVDMMILWRESLLQSGHLYEPVVSVVMNNLFLNGSVLLS
jgi:hypothetical protein